jgi:hypothetical protein
MEKCKRGLHVLNDDPESSDYNPLVDRGDKKGKICRACQRMHRNASATKKRTFEKAEDIAAGRGLQGTVKDLPLAHQFRIHGRMNVMDREAYRRELHDLEIARARLIVMEEQFRITKERLDNRARQYIAVGKKFAEDIAADMGVTLEVAEDMVRKVTLPTPAWEPVSPKKHANAISNLGTEWSEIVPAKEDEELGDEFYNPDKL